MTAHSQSHGVASTIDHEPGTNNTVVGTVAGAVIEKAFGPSAAGSTLVEREADGGITLPAADPTDPTDAASKGYVDAQIVTGVTWKELVLHCDQLRDDPNGGVSQAILFAILTNIVATETFIITDGTTTETWTAVGGAPAAFQFQVGGSAAATLTNLIAAINNDSTLWSAVESSDLDPYFAGTPATQGVIYRTAVPTGVADDRVHGVLGTSGQSAIKVVEFATGTQNYRESSGTESDLPAADPAAKRFGFNRPSTAVQTGDTHRCADANLAFTWDGDDAVWQNTDTGTSVTAGDGIDVTGGKVSTNNATATGAATQQFGGLVNDRTSDGTGAAAADQGYNAIKTDNSKLAVDQATNALVMIGLPGFMRPTFGTWTSDVAADKSPTLGEFQTYLGTTAGDIGNWGFMVESGGPGGRTGTFLVYKKANAGALTDYQSVELS
jgi:hypothetical protein